jgi:hypothetical protein
MIQNSSVVNARDFLCLFWFLIPETRQAISGSLAEEYFELGKIKETITSYTDAAGKSGAIVRQAYEFAAVGSHSEVPIPVEVMVHALGLDYVAWSEIVGQGTPLWGLIYASEWEGADTYVYHTRNVVVTQQIIRLINGSELGKRGELEKLKQLISVCNSSLPVYREFLVELLVRRKAELRHFDYEDVLELYDLALATLPSSDRSLAHHRAICIRELGKSPLEAYDALQQVVRMESSSIAEADEPLENIETSAAAAAVDAIEFGEVAASQGAEIVKKHIEKAISHNPFNIHTYHVSATHLLKVAHRLAEGDKEESAICVSEAARTVRRALVLAEIHERKDTRASDSVELLKHLRSRICQFELLDENLAEVARELIEQGDLTNPRLESALRILLLRAQEKETIKGREYNNLYSLILRINKHISEPPKGIPIGIIALHLEILTDWKIHTEHTNQTWSDICVFSDLLSRDPKHSSNPIWPFWAAVAYYHLGRFGDANAIFHRLRGVQMPGHSKHAVRTYMLDQKGNKRGLTGRVRTGSGYGSTIFVDLEDLATDVAGRRGDFRSSSGSTVLVVLGFSFAGPLALKKIVGPE